MIELTEEPYDSEVAVALVSALQMEIWERYAHEVVELTPEEAVADEAAYAREIEPEDVRRPRGALVVAWIEGKPVGCGAIKPFAEVPGTAEVKRMYTAPEARRRGVSRAVLDRLEAIARELGYTRMQLETGTEQPEAIALYESHGWHRIPSYGRYKDSPSSVCFAKDLTDP